MPEFTVTAKVLHEMASKKLRKIEDLMADHETELANLRLEHGKLYAMALAFHHDDDPVPLLPEGMDF